MFKNNRRLFLALFTLFVIAWIKSVWAGENTLFMTLALMLLSFVGVCLFIVAVLRARSKRRVWLAMVVSMTSACTAVGFIFGQHWMGLVLGFVVSLIMASIVVGMVKDLVEIAPPSTQLITDEDTETVQA